MANARLSLSRLMKVRTLLMPPSNVAYKQGSRTLFSHEILGLDGFQRFKLQINEKLRDVKDKFIPRMSEYLATETNTVFTDDLKNMIAIADSDEDIAIMEKMIKRYYTENSASVLRQFAFGPIIMRLLHTKNNIDLALSLFNDPELNGMFPQITTCVVLMDMLYEAKRYDEAESVFRQFIEARKSESSMSEFISVYPSDPTTAMFACYYRMDTPEALKKAKELVSEMDKSKANITNRGSVFACLLALNHDDPVFGYEVLCYVRSQRLTTIRNLKIKCLATMGRFDDAITLLGSVLHFTNVSDAVRQNEAFPDILESVESMLKLSGSTEQQQRFATVKESLVSRGHVSSMTLKKFNDEPVRHRRGTRQPDTSGQRSDSYGQDGRLTNQGQSNFGRRDDRGFRQFAQPWRRPSYEDDDGYGDVDSRPLRGRGFMDRGNSFGRQDGFGRQDRYGRQDWRRSAGEDGGWGRADRGGEWPPGRDELRGRDRF